MTIRSYVAVFSSTLVALLCAASAVTAGNLLVTVTNTTGIAAADLHVTFAGTGGNIYVDPLSVHAMGCPVPAVLSNPPLVTDTAVIDWGVACVEPGNTVRFLASSTGGGLTVTAAVWTDVTGAVIGPGPWDEEPPPPPGPDPFAAIKFWTEYVGGEKTYTWFRQNEDQFFRQCCRWARWIFTTTYFCLTDSRFGLLFELGSWLPLVPRTHSGYSKPNWRWESHWVWFWGLPVEKCIGSQPPGWMPVGPPPSGHGDSRFAMYNPKQFGLDVRYSENYTNNSSTWRQGADFTSAFQEAAESLVTYMNAQVPSVPIYTKPQILTEIGRRYSAAAGTLTPLISEVNYVRTMEPSSLLNDVYQDLVNVQAAASAIGSHMQPGVATNASLFQNLSVALNDLALDIGNVSSSPRFDNAAGHLSRAATIAHDASTLVAVGLTDTVKTAQFGSIMRGQMPVLMRQFAQAMWPHIRVRARVCDYAWNRSTIDAAWVIVTNMDSSEPPDSMALSISDQGEFYIPTMGINEGALLNVRFKLPTYLSISFNVNYTDGLRVGPLSLKGGDANNDDCVNLIDLAMVGAAQGQGGWGWDTSLSTADLNGDGIVDQKDTFILQQNYTKCGPVSTDVGPVRTPVLVKMEAFPNPTEGTTMVRFTLSEEASVSIRVFNVLGQEVGGVENRRYQPGETQVPIRGTDLPTGMYFCRLTASTRSGPIERVAKITVLK